MRIFLSLRFAPKKEICRFRSNSENYIPKVVMSREQKLTVIIFLVLTLIAIILFVNFRSQKDSYFDFISVWGSAASIGGFIFLFFQVKSQQALTKEVNQKIEDTKNLLTRIASISDISKGTKIAEQAQDFLKVQKFELASLRLKDLREILIQMRNYDEKHEVIKYGDSIHSRHISNINIDLNNIHDYLLKKKSSINEVQIIHNLEEVGTFITEFEIKIKDHGA